MSVDAFSLHFSIPKRKGYIKCKSWFWQNIWRFYISAHGFAVSEACTHIFLEDAGLSFLEKLILFTCICVIVLASFLFTKRDFESSTSIVVKIIGIKSSPRKGRAICFCASCLIQVSIGANTLSLWITSCKR